MAHYFVGDSSCNDYVSSLDYGQKVVSYCLYEPLFGYRYNTNEYCLLIGRKEITSALWLYFINVSSNSSYKTRTDNEVKRYFQLLTNLTLSVKNLYRGFRMRVYHNLTGEERISMLSKLYCQNPHLGWCNVSYYVTKKSSKMKS